MALIKCSECGKEISDKATTCIHCGNPIFQEKIKTMNKKKWEELTQEERYKIVAYRKLNKEWWNVPSRFFGIFILIFGMLFLFFSCILGFNVTIMFIGIAIILVGGIFSASSHNESKIWYEKNIDRLYENEILK
ncbi:MAG: zinc-ribbon domain-containing protein [Bacilli bacterium]|nr:zinc-ribbon domain-containing protein [Bacilli bacterium]